MAKELKDGEQMISGEVVDVSPGAQFRVKLDNGKEILAHSAGKLKRRKIKIILSDRVVVLMSPQYNTERGIIVEREGFRKRFGGQRRTFGGKKPSGSYAFKKRS